MARDAVTVTTMIAAPADIVWEFLTVSRQEWWPDMRFEASVGSPLVETWVEDGRELRATGTVTRIERPRTLAFRWLEPRWECPLEVVIELVEQDSITAVTLTETGFTRAGTSPVLPEEHEVGWRYHLERWKRASEGDADDGG